jgi:hypothetical protein
MTSISRIPQIQWRGDTIDCGARCGIGGELVVGKRSLKAATIVGPTKSPCLSESLAESAAHIEKRLWIANYYETLADVRNRKGYGGDDILRGDENRIGRLS